MELAVVKRRWQKVRDKWVLHTLMMNHHCSTGVYVCIYVCVYVATGAELYIFMACLRYGNMSSNERRRLQFFTVFYLFALYKVICTYVYMCLCLSSWTPQVSAGLILAQITIKL